MLLFIGSLAAGLAGLLVGCVLTAVLVAAADLR